MKYQISLYLICVLIAISCSNTTKPDSGSTSEDNFNYPFTIDLEQGMQNQKVLYLSEIADSIGYSVVCPDKSILFGSGATYGIDMGNGNICIISYTEKSGVFIMEQNGNIINTIGMHGRGPGEYMVGSPIAICKKSQEIYIRDNASYKFLIYDFSGNFLGYLPLDPSKHRHAVSFVVLNLNSMLDCYWYAGKKEGFPSDLPLFRVYTKNDSVIYNKPHPLNDYITDLGEGSIVSMDSPIRSYHRDEVIVHASVEPDTVYKVKGDSVYTAFIIKSGNYTPKPDQVCAPGSAKDKDYLRNMGAVIETKNKVYLKYLLGNEAVYIFEYDKKSGVTSSMKKEIVNQSPYISSKIFGFVNDLDGGIDYFGSPQRFSNTWIKSLSAFDFKDLHKGELPESSKEISSEQKNKLINFLDRLNEDDNPVLIRVYLKDDAL